MMIIIIIIITTIITTSTTTTTTTTTTTNIPLHAPVPWTKSLYLPTLNFPLFVSPPCTV